MPSGFLVVVADARNRATGGPYAGVCRVPYYPPDDVREERAMDEYVFGDFKDDDTNLIPSLEAAVKLCGMLRSGGRQFEIIYCRDAEQPVPLSQMGIGSVQSLGYDVAGIRWNYWSIVEDFSIGDWAIPYHKRLNPNGLFGEKSDAEAYLRDYRAHRDHDWDSGFNIVEVLRITPT